jgi:hypothetical protein
LSSYNRPLLSEQPVTCVPRCVSQPLPGIFLLQHRVPISHSEQLGHPAVAWSIHHLASQRHHILQGQMRAVKCIAATAPKRAAPDLNAVFLLEGDKLLLSSQAIGDSRS